MRGALQAGWGAVGRYNMPRGHADFTIVKRAGGAVRIAVSNFVRRKSWRVVMKAYGG